MSLHRNFRRFRCFPFKHTLRSSTTISTDSLLAVWPGEYRFGINHIVRKISEDEKYVLAAKSKCIDQIEWINFVSSFRRRAVTSPLPLFQNKKRTFLKFTSLIRKLYLDEHGQANIAKFLDSLSPRDIELLNVTKDHVFDLMLELAEIELKDSIDSYKTLSTTSDLRIPHEWYPLARLMKRKIIYHGGPTNSGKTYHALQRLKAADPEQGGGLYCGPLRLLALEVYEQMNRQGVYMNLLTGQEKREVPFATHIASTVEMVNLNKMFDVAVVDEIQMIADPARGHSWTRAVMGLQAREIHLCGGMEAKELVETLVQGTGDEFEFREYKRKTELHIEAESLKGDYSKITPGDCVVAFSRQDIFSIKHQIETLTPYKCAVIYGQLPPETRSTQARLFNEDGSGYDVLVASDAIGMGLNLNIRRTVFHTCVKQGDTKNSSYWVNPSNIKQIAGRAGRLSSSFPVGYVTTWQEADLAYVRAVMSMDVMPIPSAGIFPNKDQIQLFSTQLKVVQERQGSMDEIDSIEDFDDDSDSTKEDSTKQQQQQPPLSTINEKKSSPKAKKVPPPTTALQPSQSVQSSSSDHHVRLSHLLDRFLQLSRTEGRYFLCEHDSIVLISNWLQPIPLPLLERFEFANAPANSRDEVVMNYLYDYAAAHALGRPVPIGIRLPRTPPRDILEFGDLCTKHNILDLYLWLSLRFPKFFMEKDLCLEQKNSALEMIERTLFHASDQSLTQQYSHSEKYEKTRSSVLQTSEGLPPEEYGEELRNLTKSYLEKLDSSSHYSYPHIRTELLMRPSKNSSSHSSKSNSKTQPSSRSHSHPHQKQQNQDKSYQQSRSSNHHTPHDHRRERDHRHRDHRERGPNDRRPNHSHNNNERFPHKPIEQNQTS